MRGETGGSGPGVKMERLESRERREQQRLFQSVLLDLAVEGALRDAELVGGGLAPPVVGGKRLLDHGALHLFERQSLSINISHAALNMV